MRRLNVWIAVIYIATLVVLCAVIWLQRKMILESSGNINDNLKKYVEYSFCNPFSVDELNILGAMEEHSPDKLCVYIPESICNACLVSLIATLQKCKFPLEKVSFFAATRSDYQWQEIRSMGFANPVILDNLNDDSANDIMIVSRSLNLWEWNHMRYKDGFEEPLRVLLDNTRK